MHPYDDDPPSRRAAAGTTSIPAGVTTRPAAAAPSPATRPSVGRRLGARAAARPAPTSRLGVRGGPDLRPGRRVRPELRRRVRRELRRRPVRSDLRPAPAAVASRCSASPTGSSRISPGRPVRPEPAAVSLAAPRCARPRPAARYGARGYGARRHGTRDGSGRDGSGWTRRPDGPWRRSVGPGGPGGPGGPRGPRGPFGPYGRDDDGEGPDDGRGRRFDLAGMLKRGRGGRAAEPARRPPRRGGATSLIATFAVFIMLTGAGFVGGTYYVDSVKTPTRAGLPRDHDGVLHRRHGAGQARRGHPVRAEVRRDERRRGRVDRGLRGQDVLDQRGRRLHRRHARRVEQLHRRRTPRVRRRSPSSTPGWPSTSTGATYNRKIREAVLAWKISDQLKQGADPRVLPELGAVRPADLRHRGGRPVLLRQDGEQAPRHRSSSSRWPRRWCWSRWSSSPTPTRTTPKGEPGYDPTFAIDGVPEGPRRTPATGGST